MHARDLRLRWYVVVSRDGTRKGEPVLLSATSAVTATRLAKVHGKRLVEVPAPRMEQSHRQR